MSPKELLYVEDALGHEKQLWDVCCDAASKLTDAELKSFVQTLSARHKQNYDKLYGLLN